MNVFRTGRYLVATITALAASATFAAPASAASNTYAGIGVTGDGQGYAVINTGGGTYAFGTAKYRANPAGFTGQIAGVSVTADGSGYAAVSSAGQVYAYGTVQYRGNPAGFHGQIVGIAVTANGSGYAAVSSAGQVYAYGTVQYRGNPAGFTGQIAGISVTADGSGYAAVSSAGQVYAYGTVQHRGNPAGFKGSIRGISVTANGSGYAAVSSAGQVYAYGTVQHRGNPTGFTGQIAGISVTANGSGYAAVSSAGQIYAYGSVSYRGNADPGPSNSRLRIVQIAQRELADSSHYLEQGGYNCNFYSTQFKGGARCSNGWYTEEWCADFARWVWGQAGADTTGLSAGAVSFYSYGLAKRTWNSGSDLGGVQPGDAVVYDLTRNAKGVWSASHVGLVTAVNADGTFTVIAGNAGKTTDRVSPSTGRPDGHVSGYASPVG